MNPSGDVVRAAESCGDPSGFCPPTLDEFFPPILLFEGTPFELNRIGIVRLIALVLLLLFFFLTLRRVKTVPGRGQSVAEIAVDFVRVGIIEEMLGKRLGRKWAPLLVTIFFSVLALNITGVVPFLNIAGSSVATIPIFFAVIAYLAFIVAGFQERGFKWVITALFPPGVPWFMYLLITPLEIVNVFIVRPVSLALRLLLNMMVGHLLLALTFIATNFFFLIAPSTIGGGFAPIGALTFFAALFFTAFEILVAFLQAYVFTLLTSVYIQQATAETH